MILLDYMASKFVVIFCLCFFFVFSLSHSLSSFVYLCVVLSKSFYGIVALSFAILCYNTGFFKLKKKTELNFKNSLGHLHTQRNIERKKNTWKKVSCHYHGVLGRDKRREMTEKKMFSIFIQVDMLFACYSTKIHVRVGVRYFCLILFFYILICCCCCSSLCVCMCSCLLSLLFGIVVAIAVTVTITVAVAVAIESVPMNDL